MKISFSMIVTPKDAVSMHTFFSILYSIIKTNTVCKQIIATEELIEWFEETGATEHRSEITFHIGGLHTLGGAAKVIGKMLSVLNEPENKAHIVNAVTAFKEESKVVIHDDNDPIDKIKRF